MSHPVPARQRRATTLAIAFLAILAVISTSCSGQSSTDPAEPSLKIRTEDDPPLIVTLGEIPPLGFTLAYRPRLGYNEPAVGQQVVVVHNSNGADESNLVDLQLVVDYFDYDSQSVPPDEDHRLDFGGFAHVWSECNFGVGGLDSDEVSLRSCRSLLAPGQTTYPGGYGLGLAGASQVCNWQPDSGCNVVVIQYRPCQAYQTSCYQNLKAQAERVIEQGGRLHSISIDVGDRLEQERGVKDYRSLADLDPTGHHWVLDDSEQFESMIGHMFNLILYPGGYGLGG